MFLRTKTSLIFIVIVTVTFVVVGLFSLRFLEDSLRKSIFDGLESLSTASSESVSKFLGDTAGDVEAIAASLPGEVLEEKNIPAIVERLRKTMEIYPKFESGMFILNLKGKLWVEYPPSKGLKDENSALREHFKATMEKQKGIIGTPYRSPTTGEPILTFTALLRGRANQVIGLIGCSVSLLHPNALANVWKTRVGASGYLYIYDTSRLLILHPEDQRILQRDVSPGTNKLSDAAIEGFEGIGETVNSRGVPMLVSFKRVPGTNWILAAQQPQEEAFAPIKKAKNRMIGWTVLAAVIAILTGAIAVRRLTEPLVKLRAVTLQLGQHPDRMGKDSPKEEMDFQKELERIQSSDEIGDLARAVREMHEKLGETFAFLNETIRTLRGSEERYRLLAEAAHDMIFIISREGIVQYVNHFAASQFNVLPEQIVGRSLEELFPPEVSKRQKANLQKVFETGAPFFDENRTEFPGQEVWLETWLTPIGKDSGEVEAVLGISRDVTDRKQIEEALRASEEKYRSLVGHANDAIFIAQDGIVKFPNPSALRLTGFSEEDYATTSFLDFISPDDREMVLDRYRRRLEGEDVPNNYSFRILTKAGEELWAQLNAVSIRWDGRPAVLCFLRDITPQRRLEAQFQQAQKMEAVGTLAGGIAHDFNNLLQTVLGYTEILLHEEVGKSISQELQQIKHAALRGAELTQQILTFSRKVQSKLRPVDLNIEVRQVQKLLQRIIPKMIEVELQLADDLRVINADPAQVEQILMNLSVNARDAMPEGGNLIIGTKNVFLDESYCRRYLEAHPGEHVLLTVSDSGHGMDKEAIDHIFEPFYTTKGIGKGTGLGLAMVYGIVKSHGGHIQCLSQLGKGTTFSIYFPAIEGGTAPDEPIEGEELARGVETILIVDDEKSILDYGRRMLSAFGYTVWVAPDGESALKIYQAEKGKIDLVVLDLIMPGIGGRRCLEELLKIDPEVKVIVASGYSLDEHPKGSIEAGAKALINKPYDMKQILKTLRQVLDG